MDQLKTNNFKSYGRKITRFSTFIRLVSVLDDISYVIISVRNIICYSLLLQYSFINQNTVLLNNFLR